MIQVKFSKPLCKVDATYFLVHLIMLSFPVVKPFDQDSYFSIKALHRLEACSGISVLSTLDAYLAPLHDILGFTMAKSDSTIVLSSWRMGDTSQMKLLPTWKNLLWIIKQLSLVDLARQVENKLKEAAVLVRQQLEMTAGVQAIQEKGGEKTGVSQ